MMIFDDEYAGAIYGKITGTFASDTKDPALIRTMNKIQNVYEHDFSILKKEDELEAAWGNICLRLGISDYLEDRDIETILGLYESQYANFCYYMFYCALLFVQERNPDIQFPDFFKSAYEHLFKVEDE